MNRIFAIPLCIVLFVIPIAHAQEESDVLWVDPQEVKPEETKRRPLTPEQTIEIAQIQKMLFEVDLLPLEEWLDGFRRDPNPDHEIAVWKRIAEVYGDFLKGRNVSLDYKKEVFKVLVASSMMPRDAVPENAHVTLLSAKDIIAIMDDFYGSKELGAND